MGRSRVQGGRWSPGKSARQPRKRRENPGKVCRSRPFGRRAAPGLCVDRRPARAGARGADPGRDSGGARATGTGGGRRAKQGSTSHKVIRSGCSCKLRGAQKGCSCGGLFRRATGAAERVLPSRPALLFSQWTGVACPPLRTSARGAPGPAAGSGRALLRGARADVPVRAPQPAPGTIRKPSAVRTPALRVPRRATGFLWRAKGGQCQAFGCRGARGRMQPRRRRTPFLSLRFPRFLLSCGGPRG